MRGLSTNRTAFTYGQVKPFLYPTSEPTAYTNPLTQSVNPHHHQVRREPQREDDNIRHQNRQPRARRAHPGRPQTNAETRRRKRPTVKGPDQVARSLTGEVEWM
jgi:hypothetical protein